MLATMFDDVKMSTIVNDIRKAAADTLMEAKKPVGLKFGYLYKCSFRFKRWKQSWFVLEYKDLVYYDNDQFDAPKVISLKSQCSVLEADVTDAKRPFSFKVAIQKRTFVLSAESRSTMEAWIYAIRAISGLHAPPTTIGRSSVLSLSDQATQLMQSTADIIDLCSKLIRAASMCSVPGIYDLSKLERIGDDAIKCAASVRVVIHKPNIQSAQQQVLAAIGGIRDHSIEYNDFLGKVVMSSKQNESLDLLITLVEQLVDSSGELLTRCTQPELPTPQESLITVARAASIAASRLLVAAKEGDRNSLVEASKDLVANANMMYDMTRKILESTGYEQPKLLAGAAIDLVKILISRAKLYHGNLNNENQLDACTSAVQEKVLSVIPAAEVAEQHFILEQQLLEATTTVHNTADEVFPAAEKLARRYTMIAANRNRAAGVTEAGQDSAKQAIDVVAAARALADAVACLPGAIKTISRSTVFQAVKNVGAATNILAHTTTQFSESYASADPNFQPHLKESIQNMKNAGCQLMGLAKTVIQEEFKNQRNLLQLSSAACTHTLGVAYILDLMKLHISPKSAQLGTISSSSFNKELDSPKLRGSCSPLQSYVLTRNESSPSFNNNGHSSNHNSQSPPSSLLSLPRSPSNPESKLFLSPASTSLRSSNSARHLLDLLLDDEDHEEIDKEDVNIWNEPPDSEENIIMDVDENGDRTIKAATLNKLIYHLTTENDNVIKFQKTFIATYRSFTTPLKLFKKLLQRYNVIIPRLPPAITATEYHKRTVLPIQVRVTNVIKQWVETAFHDMNESLVKRILDFTETVLVADNHIPLAKQVRSAVDKQQKLRECASNPILEAIPDPGDAPRDSLDAFSEEEIALQLTLIDFNLYSAIKPVELLNQAWNKESLKHRAPNVLAMIHRFNAISLWAASAILLQLTLKERVAMYVRLVNVTEHLFRLNNCNTALAIISGLNNSGIYRLKYTRAELPKKIQNVFDSAMQLMNSEQSYKAYRDFLHNVNPPCVPYLGVYLTDLTFIEDGNKDFINNLINFRKRQLVFDVIAEIQLHQQLPYNIKPNEKLIPLLKNLTSSKEDQLYQMSLLREPRNAERADIL